MYTKSNLKQIKVNKIQELQAFNDTKHNVTKILNLYYIFTKVAKKWIL